MVGWLYDVHAFKRAMRNFVRYSVSVVDDSSLEIQLRADHKVIDGADGDQAGSRVKLVTVSAGRGYALSVKFANLSLGHAM